MASLRVALAPFGEGGTRLAYQAVVLPGSSLSFADGECVVLKVMKPDAYSQGLRITNVDIAAQVETKRYCEVFNEKFHGRIHKSVHAIIGELHRQEVDLVDSNGQCNIRQGDTVLLEKFIAGKFEKFNSNSGWSQPDLILPNFFSHWTYYESRGQVLVCDIQGHRGATEYILTDPTVMTKAGGQMGCTDLGQTGINNWFARHSCNSLCRDFDIAEYKPRRRPSYTDNLHGIPFTTYQVIPGENHCS